MSQDKDKKKDKDLSNNVNKDTTTKITFHHNVVADIKKESRENQIHTGKLAAKNSTSKINQVFQQNRNRVLWAEYGLVISVTIFGNERLVRQRTQVVRGSRLVSVLTGKKLLGRVVDVLGNVIDGRTALKIVRKKYYTIKVKTPGIITRQTVNQPVQTGITAIDTMIPIGRGQWELIIGDRQTGKTAIAIDAIINQKSFHTSKDEKNRIYCVYIAIGQKRSTIIQITERLRKGGVLDFTTIVAATAWIAKWRSFSRIHSLFLIYEQGRQWIRQQQESWNKKFHAFWKTMTLSWSNTVFLNFQRNYFSKEKFLFFFKNMFIKHKPFFLSKLQWSLFQNLACQILPFLSGEISPFFMSIFLFVTWDECNFVVKWVAKKIFTPIKVGAYWSAYWGLTTLCPILGHPLRQPLKEWLEPRIRPMMSHPWYGWFFKRQFFGQPRPYEGLHQKMVRLAAQIERNRETMQIKIGQHDLSKRTIAWWHYCATKIMESNNVYPRILACQKRVRNAIIEKIGLEFEITKIRNQITQDTGQLQLCQNEHAELIREMTDDERAAFREMMDEKYNDQNDEDVYDERNAFGNETETLD